MVKYFHDSEKAHHGVFLQACRGESPVEPAWGSTRTGQSLVSTSAPLPALWKDGVAGHTPGTLSDLVNSKAALKFWFLQIRPRSLPCLRKALFSSLLPQGLPSLSLALLKTVGESRWPAQFMMVLALMESVVLWDFILFLRICKLCNKLPFCTWDRVSLCRLDWSMTLCRPNWPQTHSNLLPVPSECWD